MKETRARHNYINNNEIESGQFIFDIRKGWNSQMISEENKNGLALQYLLSNLLKKDLVTFDATLHAFIGLFLF